jgi:regulation of enolase protein 1 (concanavalin A-like superfamily)
MTDGQPDFAWADEEDGIVAIKHGGDRLWISAYWQSKTGTGINGLGRFHFSTTNYDQYGVLETMPQFNFSGSFYVRPNLMDKPEQNFYVPPDDPTNAYAGERIPVGTTPAPATDDQPFRGKASFYEFRYGNYLAGLNMNPSRSYQLKVPVEFTGGSNLITGANVTVPVMVGPTSTVVLYLNSPTNSNPVPSTPLCLNAVGDVTSKIALDWNAASGATSYDVKRAGISGGPYSTIATVAGTNFNDTAVTKGMTYYYVVTGTNAYGESFYNSMEATASAGLPAPWFDVDIGVVGTAGGANYNNIGTFTVKGAGSDIGGTSDTMNYAYVSVTNNCAFIARLAVEQVSGSGLDKVGVMMRETTNANSQVQGLVLDLQSAQARFPMRYGTGANMSWQQISGAFAAPLWFKLTRTNNVFTGYVSSNGTAWIPVGTNTIPIATNYFAGLAVCSRTTSALDVSTFDNVTTENWSAPLPDAPLGLTAVVGDAQAILNWSSSTNAASYNLKRSMTNGGPYTVVGSNLGSPAFTDLGLSNGVMYYYVVSSINPVGESSNSVQVGVQPVSQSVIALNYAMVGTQLQLSWPPDHIGWRLVSQTNSLTTGLGTNWATVANSPGTNQLLIPIDPANGTVFFQLVY